METFSSWIAAEGSCSSERPQSAAPGRRNRRFITQHNVANERLARDPVPGHALLVDGSGGRGLSPAVWVRPETPKLVGFAGGLGPENLAAELPKIGEVASGRSWVNMEGKLRADDWFDVGLARECAAVFEGYVSSLAPFAGVGLAP